MQGVRYVSSYSWVCILLFVAFVNCTFRLQWVDPVALGQPNLTSSKVGDAFPWEINTPSDFALLNDQLIVVDDHTGRILIYSDLDTIRTNASATVALGIGVQDFYTHGKVDWGFMSTFTDNAMNSTIFIGDKIGNVTYSYSSPFSFNQSSTIAFFLNSNTSEPFLVDPTSNLVYTATPNNIFTNTIEPNLSITPNLLKAYNNLNNVQKMIFGCDNDIWVFDTAHSRVLQFLANSTTPHTIIGQPDNATFSPNSRGRNYSLSSPKGGSLSNNCTELWVADTDNQRVVKFEAPFTTGMSITFEIGDGSIPPGLNSFDHPVNVLWDDKSNRLWVCDFWGHRIIGGKLKNDTVVSEACGVGQNLSVVYQKNCTVLQVIGDLTLNNNSVLVVNDNQTIVTNGTITFAGNLIIILSRNLTAGQTLQIVVAQYGSYQGSFSSIEVIGVNDNSLTGECGATKEGVYGKNSLVLLIGLKECEDNKEKGGVSPGLIAGVAIGGLVVVFLALVVVSVIMFITLREIRQRRRLKKSQIVF